MTNTLESSRAKPFLVFNPRGPGRMNEDPYCRERHFLPEIKSLKYSRLDKDIRS